MKKRFCLFSSLIVLTYMCFAGNVQLKMEPVAVNENLTISIVSIKSPLSKVSINGGVFSPRDSQNFTMAEVVFEIINSSEVDVVDFPLNNLKNIELVTADENGNLDFSGWDIPKKTEYNKNGTIKTDNIFSQDTFSLKPGKNYKMTVIYTYKKNTTPVAFMKNREVIHSLVNTKTKNAEVVSQNLTKQKYIPECMGLVIDSKSTKDDVINFMSEHNITFTDKDASGNTIFYYSIVAKKNDIFDAAVEQSDLNQLYYYKYEKVTPIQLAVLTVNDYAVTKLINSGESLVSDKNQNIGKMVVTFNNTAAAKLLAKHNFDFSTVTMGNGWGPGKTPVQWCKDKGYKELEQFLNSLGYTE